MNNLDILLNRDFIKTVFSLHNEEDLNINLVSEDKSDHHQAVIRAIILGYYISKCLLVVRVQVLNDFGSSFKVYHSLNSTGKELTSLERFKPKIIENVVNKHANMGTRWDEDKEVVKLNDIDSIISECYSNMSNKDKHMKNIVTVFSLVLDGTKLPNKYEEQSLVLNENYNKLNKIYDGEFLKILESVVTIYKIFFNKKQPLLRKIIEDMNNGQIKLASIDEHISEASYCFNYIGYANSHMALAVIARYFHHVKYNYDIDSIRNLCEIIRSVAAFHVVWRSCEQGSTKIDSVFRSVFNDKINPAAIYKFDNNNCPGNALPSVNTIQEKLYICLNEQFGLSTGEEWAEKVKGKRMYGGTINAITRMILITGSHLTNVEQSKLVIQNKNVGCDTIKEKSYISKLFETIEHINPQSRSTNKVVDNKLWNLVLIPNVANSLLKDKPVKTKKLLYQIFSCKSKNEYERLAENLDATDLKKKVRSIGKQINEFGSLPMLDILGSSKTTSYSEKEADQRINTILENCWKILVNGWLDNDTPYRTNNETTKTD